MLKSEIQPGSDYVLRERREIGVPFQRVRIIEHVRKNKWKTKWIEPNPGLVDYVESGQLIVPWKERKAFLREEESAERLRNHNRAIGYEEESPVANALYEIFENVGDDVGLYRGVLTGSPGALARVKTRAKAHSESNSQFSYIDRTGKLHLPFDEALELARKFCAAEPAAVLAAVESTEREWAQEARRPGEEHMVKLLNEYRAAWALVRQWAGHDAAVAQREEQIQKLERLGTPRGGYLRMKSISVKARPQNGNRARETMLRFRAEFFRAKAAYGKTLLTPMSFGGSNLRL